MSIKRMHYLFKQKLNKIDSSQNINFRTPEIDMLLREAELMFIRQRILKTTHHSTGSLDFNNELSDDIKTIVKTVTLINVEDQEGVTPIENNTIAIPDDYLYYIESKVSATKDQTTSVLKGLFTPLMEELTSFNSTSFEWGEINVKLRNNQIEYLNDGDFSINEIYLTYIKKPVVVHNAEDYSGTITVEGDLITDYYNKYQRLPKGLNVSIDQIESSNSYTLKGYKGLDGTLNFGYIDSELPYHTHDQIVDIAVMKTMQSITNNMEFQNDKTT